MSLYKSQQVSSVQQEQDQSKNRTLWHSVLQIQSTWLKVNVHTVHDSQIRCKPREDRSFNVGGNKQKY